MYQLLVGIIKAIARFAKRTAKRVISWVSFGGGPAKPIESLEEILPDPEEITQEVSEVAAEQQMIDITNAKSAAHQVRLYSLSPEESRHSRDLDLLSFDQRYWLKGLHDNQLAILASASDRQINDALSGQPLAVGAVQSVGWQTPEPVAPTLARKIAAHRSATRSESHHVMH